MSNVVTAKQFRDVELKMIRRTVAADLTPAEFDQFIHMCRHYGLDPIKRQIYAIVYKRKKKDDDGAWHEDRRVTMVTAIDGYRSIADRTGNYRPGQRSVVTEDAARNPECNPHGIVSATASVWKRAHGEWHEFSETVYWEEYAPLKEVWENKKPTGKYKLDTSGQWGKMGRVMLQKCAEAQALRRGWPDDFAGLYVAEELDRSQVIDLTPSEAADEAERNDRQLAIGGPSLPILWPGDGTITYVPIGQFGDRVLQWIETNKDEPSTVMVFADQNRETLRQYWGHDKDGALTVKTAIESVGTATGDE